jgi:hypothetical protein
MSFDFILYDILSGYV